MKFFLVKDANEVANAMQYSGERKMPNGSGSSSGYYRSTTRTVDIMPISWDPLEVEKCALLKKFLKTEAPYDGGAFWTCKVEVGVSSIISGSIGSPQSTLEIFFKRSLPERDCLGQMSLSLPGSKVQVEWTLVDRDGAVGKISTQAFFLNNGRMCHESWSLKYPGEKWWTPSRTILNRMTITVTVPDDVFITRCGGIPAPLPSTILEEGVFSDVTILCGDGTEIKAHRNFLAARSPVFLAMFQTDMKESRESTVEISDMETKSVQAFLKFLYYGHTKDAEGSFQVAFELFQAGHKYGIKFLEERMRRLITQQPNNWFNLEAAVKLFMFVRNLTPTDERLKMKMAKVLQLRFATLEDSPMMQELFRNDHKAALELVKYIAMHQ